MIKQNLSCKIFCLAVVLSFSVLSAFAAKPGRYSVASGNWNATSTWSDIPGGPPGASVPGNGTDVFIENGHTVTVTASDNCASLTFTGADATLIVNLSVTLTVKNAVTLDNLTSLNSACTITGAGTLACSDIAVGSTTNPPPNDLSSSIYTHTFTSTIAFVNISGNPTGNLTINSYYGSASNLRNGVFRLESGTVTITKGSIITVNENAANTSVFSMAVGANSGTLVLSYVTPFIISPAGTSTINLNGTASLVNYNRAGVQTVFPAQYNNLTLSGSGAKTVTGATVNGTLSMESIATAAGTTPIFGTLSSLQYKGSAAQTTGIEFPATFSGAGGVIIDNAMGVTLNTNRIISSKLTFISGLINTGANVLNLTSTANVTGAGAGKYVNGNLQKDISAGTVSKIFEIGDASVYAPVNLSFAGTINAGGSITAKTTPGDHPNILSSTFNAGVTVNRYWTLTNSGVTGFISYSATFNFVAGDIDAGADFNYFFVGNYNPVLWTYPTVGTLTATSTQATGLTYFGDFQVGELPISSFRSRQSGDWNLISTWESYDGTNWVAATSTPTSSAGFITIRPSTVVTNTGPLTVDQVIIDAGGKLILSSGMTVINGPGVDLFVNGILDCNAGTLTGPGSFLLDNGADIIITSPEGITSSGATGNIQTTTRTFSDWANYTYNGTAAQVTGSGLPAIVNNLSISNSAGVSLTNSVTANGILTLAVGVLDLGVNSLILQNSDTPIVRTSGSITASSDSDISFGTPGNTGGADFTIPPGTFTFAPSIRNFTINRLNVLTLNDQVISLKGILLCNGPLTTNGNLTLLSTAAQTAAVDGNGTGQITGNITMQRYLPSGYGYKYFSSPFQSATVNEFADDITLGPFTFFRYDENRTSSGWVSYHTPTTNPLVPLQGYAVNFGSVSAPNTVDASGAVNNGVLSASLLNHDNTFTKGFNLIGNPYPSPIDWDAITGWTKINIDNALYFFKASTTDQYGGTYISYVNGVSTGGTTLNIIPSMQGFFVHVTDGPPWPVTGTLGMDNSVRVTNQTQPFTKSGMKSPVSLLKLTTAFSDDTASFDPAVIYIDDKASSEFDWQLDALKLMNTDLNVSNLYSVTPAGAKLSINALPDLVSTSDPLPLGLKLNRDGFIIFRIRNNEGPFSTLNISLFDKVAGTVQDLLSGKEYKLYLTAGEYLNRFFLNFSSVATGVHDNNSGEDLFSIYSSHGLLKAEINTISGKEGTLKISNLTGQIIYLNKVYECGYHEFNPRINDGIYIITFITGNKRSSKKILIQN